MYIFCQSLSFGFTFTLLQPDGGEHSQHPHPHKTHPYKHTYIHHTRNADSDHVTLPAADAQHTAPRVASRAAPCANPIQGGCAGVGWRPLLAVAPLPPLPLTLPGASLPYAASPTPASASSRRLLEWGDATRHISPHAYAYWSRLARASSPAVAQNKWTI